MIDGIDFKLYILEGNYTVLSVIYGLWFDVLTQRYLYVQQTLVYYHNVFNADYSDDKVFEIDWREMYLSASFKGYPTIISVNGDHFVLILRPFSDLWF